MNQQLPQGWAVVQVQELFHSFSGGTPSKSNPAYWGGKIPWFSSGDIKSPQVTSASESITRAGLDNSSARLCRPGSVLVVVRSGVLKHTLPVAILEREAAINQDLKCFDSGDNAINKWLALSLRASENDLLALNREGTTVQSVKYETLKEHELPIPPPAEQQRIVAKIEVLLGKVDACRKRLGKIPVILKRFRQSVLAAACSGRLTTDWREIHSEIESAQNLLLRIRDSRTASAKSNKGLSQIAAAFEDGNLAPDESEMRIQDIPETWVACRVGTVGAVSNGSTPSRKEDSFWGGDIPWVSSGEVRNNVIKATRERISRAGYEASSVHLLPRGTVLIAMIGEGKTRGQSAVLDIEATINQNVAAVVLEHGLVRSDYLWRWF